MLKLQNLKLILIIVVLL
ncbi:hypothetical protein [Zhouia spongiae]